MTTLVWLRDDLRLCDNPALNAAASDPDGIIVVYILEHETQHVRGLGGAAKWWLHYSIKSFRSALSGLGISLILRSGKAEEIIPEITRESGADRVFWNRRYSAARHHDSRIKANLVEQGIEVKSFTGDLLFEPLHTKNKSGLPYRVFSSFWRACMSFDAPALPLPAPQKLSAAERKIYSESLEFWSLLPETPDWSQTIAARWIPGEESAHKKLSYFLDTRVKSYSRRDFPAETNCSELSPHLRWGEITPRQVWHASIGSSGDIGLFLSEIGWREFAKHTSFHFGPLHKRGLNPNFDNFPWKSVAGSSFEAWKFGNTGFGIVDAGMQELWQTGFMHNRVRMITASFLTKNMQIDWRLGEEWFWDTLVDADEASNPFNWQWVAGCGADAAPYFRIFNPELQAKKFDPEGIYVNNWAPHSTMLPKILDLKQTREDALMSYRSIMR